MNRLGIFVLVAASALPPAQALAQESKAERQQARQQAAVSRMVARSRPSAPQARGPMSPAMQRPAGMPQPRAFRPDGGVRSSRYMDPDMSRGVRQRAYQPQIGDFRRPRQGGNTTASVEQPRPITTSAPRVNGRDANRAERMRDWMERNRPGRDRNRGGDTTVVPGANVENQTGAVTSPETGRRDGRRHWGDHDHDDDDDRDHADRGSNRHRNWHDRNEGDPDFERRHRRWHNREWYRRNYNRFVLFGGGYYYWNRGYWYPAYGYHPSYSSYVYDAPIYSYNGLPPGQVLAVVQTQLQQRGYYNAAVDGTYGPVTRQALLNYQADHGLPMTGEIDQETLLSLGLSR